MPNKISDDNATHQVKLIHFLKEEKFVRYMIEYTIRAAGLTHTENFAGAEALLTAFGKWKPEDGLTVHAFVSNLAGNGGYVLVESSDPKVIVSFVSKYNFWNEVKVVPVIEVGDAVPVTAASLGWAQSASKS
jgi:Protein of unknown function (DUF3303)